MSEIILYSSPDGAIRVEVAYESDTFWLTQQQIADLFGTTQQNVSLHLQGIYEEGELDADATHKDFLLVRREGNQDLSEVSRQLLGLSEYL